MLPWRYVYCFRRRRTCGKTTGIDGQHPKYDKLDRGLSYYNALHHQNICSLEVPHEITITETLREHNHHSVDFSELREFMRDSESDVCSEEMIEIGVTEQATSFHRRRFSVDLGEVREFISFREMRMALENEYTAWDSQKSLKTVIQPRNLYIFSLVHVNNLLYPDTNEWEWLHQTFL